MSAPFVPFLKPRPRTAAPETLTTDEAAVAGAFTALNAAPGPANACAHDPAGLAGKPSVTLQRDGDRVTHIRIQCACGQVIELDCAY